MQLRVLVLVLLGVSQSLYAIEAKEDIPEASASEKAKWEFGLGLGGLSVPHYRGAEQRHELAGPVPYVRFRGERLQVDREGGRYFFINNETLKLDVSAVFSLPVDSNDNDARRDMPDLDAILEIGPQLQWYLSHSEDHRLRTRIGLPVRVALTLPDAGLEGFFFAPYFQVRYYSGMETAFSLGPMWATEKYHDYFYQVDPQYATAQRPAYDARAGYSGFRFTLTNSHRISKHYWWGGFLRYDRLSGAIFEDSPLVKKKDAVMAGFAISYIFNPVKAYYQDPLDE